MDDADILLSYLYTNPPKGIPRQKIESAHADWKVALERGEKIGFGDMLVRRGILPRGEPQRVLAAEKAAFGKSSIKDDKKPARSSDEKKRAPSTPRPVKAAPQPVATPTPASKDRKKPDKLKPLLPAVLVGVLGAALVWRFISPKLGPPVDAAINSAHPHKTDWLEAPASGGGIPPALPTGTDPLLDVVRDVIAEATTGDPEAATQKLEKEIQDAKTPEDKARLEEARWRLKVIKKQRKAAQDALEEAKRLAREGKIEEAADKIAAADAPEGSPERKAVEEAKRGGGEVGRSLEPTRKDDASKPGTAPSKPPRKRGERPRVPRKDRPLPAAPTGGGDEGVAAPPPPPDAGDDGAKVATDDFKLAKKTEGRRKHGQRPRGEAKDGSLVVSFIDEVDEDPEDDDAADPASFKGGVAPIPLATPKEVEPERRDAVAKVASDGLVYLERVQAWVREQREYREGSAAREARRVKEATSATARFLRRIEIPGGLVLNDAVVCKYDAQGFVLKDPNKRAEWGSPWTLNPDIASEVRRIAADPDEPRDLLRLGRWFARYRYFTQAKGAFRKALSLDPTLANRVPDLDALEKVTKLFNGRLVRSGDAVKVTWSFDASSDVADFDPQGSIWVSHGKCFMECRDKQTAMLVGQRPVQFSNGVALDARFDPTPGYFVLGLRFRSTDEEHADGVHMVLLRYDIQTGRALLADLASPQPLAVGMAGSGVTTARIELTRDSIAVRAGSFQARVPLLVPPSWEVTPFAGSLGGTIGLEQLVFSGRAHAGWLKTFLGGSDFRMSLLLEDAIGAPPFAYQHPTPPLSAEVASLASDVTPEVLEIYKKAKRNIERGTPGSLIAGLGELKFVTEETPDYAPAQYLLAKAALSMRRTAFALDCLNQAVSSAGGFAEALALRAHVLARLRRFDEARADVNKALEWRRDLASVHTVAGELALAEQHLVDARDDLELSFALDPKDEYVESRAVLVAHAVDGPPWDKPTKYETDHYAWTSSLKKDRVEQIANLLETVRPLYESALGIKAPDEKRKSAVLFFDSVNSFQDYNQIAIQSGLHEAAIGVFFPLTKELQVCDVLDDPSGMKTCAIAFHEGFHQYFDRIVPTESIPYWANEGLGDYFGGAVLDTGILRVGQLQRGRLTTLFQLGAIPLDDLMNDDGVDFMRNGFQRYAQSWSVVHYLMEGDGEKWKPLLVAYLEHLRAGRSPVNAYNRTFGRIDMDELEAGWRRHVLALGKQLSGR